MDEMPSRDNGFFVRAHDLLKKKKRKGCFKGSRDIDAGKDDVQ
jgi:hypothetical protein